MNLTTLNFTAILVAALACFLIGGIWYSPLLFYRAWKQENGLTEQNLQNSNQGKIFGLSFLLSLVIAFNLAMFLHDGKPDLLWGITAGALAGVGWVATAMGVTYLFERKSWRLFLINAGYHILSFLVMGAILGTWK